MKFEAIKHRLQKIWNKSVAYLSGRADDQKEKEPLIRYAMLFGVIVLLIFLGIFLFWTVFTPLESAAIAPGKVVVASNVKIIQHLEGGIIKEIYVKDGSIVKTGDPLLQLENTQAKATYSLLHQQTNELLAIEARLEAERDNQEKIQFPSSLLQKNDEETKKVLRAQQAVFISHKATLNGQLEILNKRIDALTKQIEGFRAQVTSNVEQYKYIQEELKAVRILDAKHLIERSKLWALEREAARLKGNQGELNSSIAEAEQKIGETKQQIITLKDSRLKEILDQLNETHRKLVDNLERERAAEDVLKRTLIVSPQNGIVTDLQEHTIGGVILAGKAIMTIVPTQDKLIIEARVNPLDIDVVHPGLRAKIQLTPYKQRRVPWVTGVVTYVSANSTQDAENKAIYYMVHVIVAPQELKQLKGVTLYPGMPVNVMIINEKRTPFNYFFSPIEDSFYKAFREQ